MTKKIADVAHLERRLPKIQASIEKAENDFNESTRKIEELEAELSTLGEAEELEASRKALSEKMKINKVSNQPRLISIISFFANRSHKAKIQNFKVRICCKCFDHAFDFVYRKTKRKCNSVSTI